MTFLPFTKPFLTRGVKVGSQLSSITLLFTKIEIADTDFCFQVAKDPISDSKNKYTEEDIINTLEFLVDNNTWSSEERFSIRKSAFPWAQIVSFS